MADKDPARDQPAQSSFDPDKYLSEFNPDEYLTGKGEQTDPYISLLRDVGQTGREFLSGTAGLASGLVSLPNQINRLLATTGLPMRDLPGSDWLHQAAQETTGGQVGEFAGGIAPYLAQPELGIGTRLAQAGPRVGQALKTGWDVFRRSALPGVLQPTDPNADEGVLAQTARNAMLSTLLGEGLQGAGHWVGRAVQPLVRKAEQRAADFTHNMRLDELRKQAVQALEAWKGQTAQEQATHQAIADAAEQAQKGRALAEKTADVAHEANVGVARSLHETAQAAAEIAQQDIPRATTERVWQEARALIGRGKEPPLALNKDTSATVQNEVGAELNRVRSQMVYDTRGSISRPNASVRRLHDLNDGSPEFKEFVLDPIGTGTRMTGSDLADYIGSIGKEAQRLRIRAANDPQYPQGFQMADRLQRAIDLIEADAKVPNQQLKVDLGLAKRAYTLWSIGDEATSAGSTVPHISDPSVFLKVMERRYAGSPARLGLSSHPDIPKLQAYLEDQQRAFKGPTGPGSFIPPSRPPGPPSSRPTPAEVSAQGPFTPSQPKPTAPTKAEDYPYRDIPKEGRIPSYAQSAILHLMGLHGLPRAGAHLMLDPTLRQVAFMASRMNPNAADRLARAGALLPRLVPDDRQ